MSKELIAAVGKNDPKTVHKLIREDGVNINLLGDKGYSALHGASISGYSAIVKLLLENGADTESASANEGFTPLHFAAMEGHADIVEMLLAFGANPNSKDSWGNTPVFRAGNKEEIGKMIIKAGGDPAIKNENGVSPLNSPAVAFNYLRSKDQEVVEVNYRALVNKGDITTLKTALDTKEGDIEAKNEQGKSALYLAVEKENLGMIELLVNAGANVNTQEKFGYTPLAIAAMRGKLHLVKYLIEKGAKTNIQLPNGSTLENLASKHPDIVAFLSNC